MRILLADNHAQNRTVIKQLLEQEPELTVIGEAGEAQDLLIKALALCPALVLIDWGLPGLQGSRLLRELHMLGRCLKVVAYSECKEARREALSAGADAFASRDEPMEWLLNTLYAVAGLSPCYAG